MQIEVKHPADLDEAIELLKGYFAASIDEIKAVTEREFSSRVHHMSGRTLRNEWFLWWFEGHGYKEWPQEKPKIVAWFNNIGIVHADDMSGILMTCLYRNLKGEDYKLDDQVERYKKHWREQGYPDGIPKMDK